MGKILLELIILVIGFALLIKGADVFVDGAAGVAELFGIPELIIGLTVVAMGTSAPEAAVSITSALKGSADIAIGNVLGSNLLNVLLVLGVTALVKPIAVGESTRKIEIPFLIFISAIFLIFSNKQYVTRLEGLALWALFILYISYTIRVALKAQNEGGQGQAEDEENGGKKKQPAWKLLLFIVLGIAMIVGGSNLSVDAASEIALLLGVSKRLIALTVVAFGTSLPELVTSVMAARKGNADIAIGNIVGSNIFNYLFIIGTTALIIPVPFDPKFRLDAFLVILVEALLLALVSKTKKLTRPGAALMLACYAGYLVYLII
ncbi:MAG: calcium/sodium antiporter [Eubacterium sp.]|nr:calcium/sodium antiporter [Eubacterium sp.]